MKKEISKMDRELVLGNRELMDHCEKNGLIFACLRFGRITIENNTIEFGILNTGEYRCVLKMVFEDEAGFVFDETEHTDMIREENVDKLIAIKLANIAVGYAEYKKITPEEALSLVDGSISKRLISHRTFGLFCASEEELIKMLETEECEGISGTLRFAAKLNDIVKTKTRDKDDDYYFRYEDNGVIDELADYCDGTQIEKQRVSSFIEEYFVLDFLYHNSTDKEHETVEMTNILIDNYVEMVDRTLRAIRAQGIDATYDGDHVFKVIAPFERKANIKELAGIMRFRSYMLIKDRKEMKR